MYIHVQLLYHNCERSKLSSLLMAGFSLYILFQVDHRSVNVLCVSKYPPNVIFRNANINAQT